MSLFRSKHIAFAVVIALAAAGCGSGDAPGVRIEEAQADIVFGVAAPEEAELADLEPPIDTQAGDVDGPISANPGLVVPFRNPLPDRFNNVGFEVPGGPGASCPSAPIGAAPASVAERNAAAPPEPGLYRYKISGTRTMTINGSEIKTPVTGFEPRLVQAVEKVSETFWRFQVVQPNGDGTRITTYSVNTDPTEAPSPTSADQDGDGVPDGRGVSTPYLGENPVRAGEPGRGIAIEMIEDFDDKGNGSGSFDASPSLLVMPLPVLPGEAFQSIAVDNRGQSMQIDGEVLDRQTVDACGELVDGWLVTQEVTDVRSVESSVRQEQYIFSTPMGGLPVSQRIVGEQNDPANNISTKYDLTYSIGQLEPSELPDRVQ